MSVYTSVTHAQLQRFLSRYCVGELVAYRGISDGMENSNFLVRTSGGEYVLTLFEARTLQELPYYLDLVLFLSTHGAPCAAPVADGAGQYLGVLNAKPAALFERLPGDWLRSPDAQQCEALGRTLGKMHRVGRQYRPRRVNDTGLAWMQGVAEELLPRLAPDEQVLLREELSYQQRRVFESLPQGVIHGDLFRDNVLFTDTGQLSGVIDFYNACDELLLYDLAITVNDWCVEAGGGLDRTRTQALLRGYHAERPFTPAEREAWSPLLRRAALRFWLSRLREKFHPRPGEMALYKDPDEFKRQLQARRGGVVWMA